MRITGNSEEDISENVRRAIELEKSIKQKRIQENIPAWLQTIFKQFAGVKGSKADTNLEIGKLVYYSFVLKKQVDKNPVNFSNLNPFNYSSGYYKGLQDTNV